jgi:hypothetical protein
MSKIKHEIFDLIQEINYPVTLPFSGISLTVTPYKHGDLKPVLRLFEEYKRRKRGHLLKALSAMENLVQRCIKPDVTGQKINVRSLQIADFAYLMNYLKSISDGETSTVSFHCIDKECDGLETFNFIIDDCEVINLENKTRQIEIKNGSKNLQLFLKPYSFGTLISNSELFASEIETGDEITKFYASFVDGIGAVVKNAEGKEEEKVYDNLPPQIIIKFLDEFTEAQLKPLVDYIENCPKLRWYKERNCEKCGLKIKAKIEEIMDFFV